MASSPIPVDPSDLPGLLADLCAAAAGSGRLRVAVDGAPAAGPGALADALVDPLVRLGVSAHRVRAGDFLLPASLRYEYGRHDLEAYAGRRLDVKALDREVLSRFAADGRWLPALRDPDTDRSIRLPYERAPDRAVLIVDGDLLLAAGLPFDLTVHLRLTPPALRRRTPVEDHWTLPAYADYAPAADVVVRADDPRHPAVTIARPASAR